jgi:uncharacterized protein (DUF2141 family)
MNLLLLVLITAFSALTPVKMPTLTIDITNIKKSGGSLRVAVFKPTSTFGGSKPDFHKIIPIEKPASQRLTFELEPGNYAVAVYHDVNNNDKLDKNLVGYPREPFGFSNNYRPVLSGPDFSDCSFEVGSTNKQIAIRLLD